MDNILSKVKDQMTLDKILSLAFKTPGVKIKRDVFLRKELIKYCPEDVIKEAIKYNPAKAGISKKVINKVSMSVINYETTKVTALSVAASIPSSVTLIAGAGAAAADLTSFFAHIIRVVQELAYLYGFAQFDFNEDNVDSETMNNMMLFMGVMFGVQGAASTLQKAADALAKHVSKKLAQQALTKTFYYPVVKKTAAKIGIRITKQVFADTVASAIPVAGGVLSGGLTYAMFKPCCMKLRKTLMSYNLCDPDYYRVIDAEYIENNHNL